MGAECDVTPVIHHAKTMDLDAVQQRGCPVHASAARYWDLPAKTFN